MRLNFLSDAYWEARVERVLDELSVAGYRELFSASDYGRGLNGITVVFVCQDPSLNLKQRVNFVKKERKLYIDVLLDLDEMKKAQSSERKRIVVERLSGEVPSALHTQWIQDFDEARFVEDFKRWLASIA
jgi:hypothetical protein